MNFNVTCKVYVLYTAHKNYIRIFICVTGCDLYDRKAPLGYGRYKGPHGFIAIVFHIEHTATFFHLYYPHPRLQVLHLNKAGLFPLPKRCLFVWRGTSLMGWACAALRVCSGGVAKRYSTQWRLRGKKWRPLWKWVHEVKPSMNRQGQDSRLNTAMHRENWELSITAILFRAHNLQRHLLVLKPLSDCLLQRHLRIYQLSC